MSDEKIVGAQGATEDVTAGSSAPDAASHAAPRAHPLKMNAYYFGFTPTGVELVDRVLSAVAHAGKGYHHTEDWAENNTENWDCFRGHSYAEWIQRAAEDAAASQRELLEALKAVTEHMDRAGGDAHGMPECPWCKAGPEYDTTHAGDCDLLKARAAIAKAEGRS